MLPIERDFFHVHFAHRIRRVAREEFQLECKWIRFEALFYSRRVLIERLGAVNEDGSIEWIADIGRQRVLTWVRPVDGWRYEVQAPRGEVPGWENGGRISQ